MSFAILQNASAIAMGVPTAFAGTGGTAPYTYAVLPGGAGGSISSGGVYTAPRVLGIDTIRVKDSAGQTLTTTISVLSPLQLICDIIAKELGLSSEQVFIYNQKWTIPNDERLYVAVGILTDKPFGNTNRSTGDAQVQSVNVHSNISIDIMSRSTQALDRKEEIIMALASQYAESQQALNSFQIGKISSSFVNLSEIDGAAIPYRFSISVGLQYFITKTRSVSYFDTFPGPDFLTED